MVQEIVYPERQWQNSTSRTQRSKEEGGKTPTDGVMWLRGANRKEKKNINKQEAGTCGLSAARDAFALPPVLLGVHRVLRVLILVRAARRPRTATARPCTRADTDAGADTRRTGRRGGRVVREDHHSVPALSARRHGERDWDREGRFCGSR